MSENNSMEENVAEPVPENVGEADLMECNQVEVNLTSTQSNLQILRDESALPKGLPELTQTAISISIKFHDDVVSNTYKSKFLEFISSFPEFQVQDDGCIIRIYRNENVSVGEDVEATPNPPKKRKKHSKVKKELFVVDATPSNNVLESDLRYTTKFVINTDKEADPVGPISKSSCFNCGEAHALKDCSQPKDYPKIQLAKQKFKLQAKSSRYHTEEQRFAHVKPGKISNELRKALGLEKYEVPHYIYLMRKLGYPPGWLEEAKFVNSNLDMFDIDGNFVKNQSVKKRGLDENKIVEYAGFNIPFQKGVKDDYRTYQVPPYSENFSKQAMIGFFHKAFVQDKDLDSHSAKVGPDTVIKQVSGTEKQERISPSLVDLEQQKRQLLEELNEEPLDEAKCVDNESDKGFLAVKTSCFGTPLLKSSSPYSKLPCADNFSKDVSPVINFENLPNSTGKYEQLTDVLQKVRDTLKKVQSNA